MESVGAAGQYDPHLAAKQAIDARLQQTQRINAPNSNSIAGKPIPDPSTEVPRDVYILACVTQDAVGGLESLTRRLALSLGLEDPGMDRRDAASIIDRMQDAYLRICYVNGLLERLNNGVGTR